METITQILKNINTLNTHIFEINENIGALNECDKFPKEIEDIINNIEFIKLVDDCNKSMVRLSDYLNPNLKKIKKFINQVKEQAKNNGQPYAGFKVDGMPLFAPKEIHKQLDYKEILSQNSISEIKRKKEFAYKGCCPHCGAPSSYLYDNTGKEKHYLCKVCGNTFTDKVTPRDTGGIYCPHCGSKLEMAHDRNGFIVYKCHNYKCSYYLKNKKEAETDPEKFKTNTNTDRFHYHYREFKFDIEQIKEACKHCKCKLDLSKIHFDHHVLGLAMTYYVNYGLSCRKTKTILEEVHGVSISHQTILNYAQCVSNIIKGYVDYYPYDLTSVMSADETYVHVKGKEHYVFFFSDPVKKIITSYTIYANRDTKAAVESIYKCISKYKEIPEDLTLIADGNPIYNAAQLFFEINNIKFDLHQVIGLTNKTEDSKTYRPIKQVEERLNRTFKQNYYGTNGYGNLECANSYMVLYVAYFNFLRKHSALNNKTPVDDDLFEENTLMPDKWLKLIDLATKSPY